MFDLWKKSEKWGKEKKKTMTGKNLSRPYFLRPIPILIRTISICPQTVQDSRPEIRFGIRTERIEINVELKVT